MRAVQPIRQTVWAMLILAPAILHFNRVQCYFKKTAACCTAATSLLASRPFKSLNSGTVSMVPLTIDPDPLILPLGRDVLHTYRRNRISHLDMDRSAIALDGAGAQHLYLVINEASTLEIPLQSPVRLFDSSS